MNSRKNIFLILFALIFILQTSNIEASSSMLKKVVPAVVRIQVSNHNKNADIEDFYKYTDQNKASSSGSGVLITEAGLIVTNKHVIQTDDTLAGTYKNIKVILSNGLIVKATVINKSYSLDLALLQLDKNTSYNLPYLQIYDLRLPEIGEDVFAIGNALGFGTSVTKGIVSAFSVSNRVEFGRMIQTDAAINSGNSGGPLIDTQGRLLGINTAVSRDGVAMGYAIPSSVIKLFVERSLSDRRLKEYWLGFAGVDVDSATAKEAGLNSTIGILITKVYPNSPATKAGLRANDILLSMDFNDIYAMADLSLLTAHITNSDVKKLNILRANKILELFIIPEIPPESVLSDKNIIKFGFFKDVEVINNSSRVALELHIDAEITAPVVYNISSDSIMYNLGLRRGDVINSINTIKIQDVKQLTQVLNDFYKLNKLINYIIIIQRKSSILEFNLSS